MKNLNTRIKACVFCIEKRQRKCTCRLLENITVFCLSVFITISFLQKTVIRKKNYSLDNFTCINLKIGFLKHCVHVLSVNACTQCTLYRW